MSHIDGVKTNISLIMMKKSTRRLDLYFFWILDLAIWEDEMAKPSMNTLDPDLKSLLRAIIIFAHNDDDDKD